MNLKLVTPEECVALAEGNVESSVSVINSLMVSVERIVALNLDFGRTLLEQSISHAKTLFAAKDAQALLALQHSASQPDVGRIVEYSNTVFDIVTQTHEDISRAFEEKLVDAGKRITSTLQNPAFRVPGGSDQSIAALRGAVGGADAAYEHMGKAFVQFMALGQAQIAAATRMALEAVGEGAKRQPRLRLAA
ncbi:MAG: phasin family protein [Rhodocyclaceae bacterium]|nr:phasin family protein [Rhodocyclaceae bacterium]MBX3667723.1 phasin family protein [Rhodocyclaceae bacterium]